MLFDSRQDEEGYTRRDTLQAKVDPYALQEARRTTAARASGTRVRSSRLEQSSRGRKAASKSLDFPDNLEAAQVSLDAADASSLRGRPIAAAVEYVTGPVLSRLTLSALSVEGGGLQHLCVLQDSMERILAIRGVRFDADGHIMVTAAGFNARPLPLCSARARGGCTGMVCGSSHQFQPMVEEQLRDMVQLGQCAQGRTTRLWQLVVSMK